MIRLATCVWDLGDWKWVMNGSGLQVTCAGPCSQVIVKGHEFSLCLSCVGKTQRTTKPCCLVDHEILASRLHSEAIEFSFIFCFVPTPHWVPRSEIRPFVFCFTFLSLKFGTPTRGAQTSACVRIFCRVGGNTGFRASHPVSDSIGQWSLRMW